jgi:hypothetical protein
MAQMMQAEPYRPMHVKTLHSQKLRTLLTHRKLLQSKAIAVDNLTYAGPWVTRHIFNSFHGRGGWHPRISFEDGHARADLGCSLASAG